VRAKVTPGTSEERDIIAKKQLAQFNRRRSSINSTR